jgi:hypothetical protein
VPETAQSRRSPAAANRVASTLRRLERLNVTALAVAPLDGARREARRRARDAASGAGRAELLDEAVRTARDLAARAFSQRGFSGTWAVADWSISTARASDRVAVADAFEDAVTAAVAEDLVDDDTIDTLRLGSEELASMTAAPEPGSLSQLFRGRPVLLAIVIALYFVILAFSAVTTGSPVGATLLVVGAAIVVAALSASRYRRSR